MAFFSSTVQYNTVVYIGHVWQDGGVALWCLVSPTSGEECSDENQLTERGHRHVSFSSLHSLERFEILGCSKNFAFVLIMISIPEVLIPRVTGSTWVQGCIDE